MRYEHGSIQKLEQKFVAFCIKSKPHRKHFQWAAMTAVIILLATSGLAGAVPTQQGSPSGDAFAKYLPLLQELGYLQEKMQREIQFPPLRSQSKLLPLLPASTEIYLALPNYGDSLHQAVEIFHRALKEREVLRDQWQSFPAGPMVEDGLDKVYQFSQYLGNEIAVSGELKPKGGSALIIAEIRKPGLSAFLKGLVKQFTGAANGPVQILSPQELLTAKSRSTTHTFVLVRADLVVVAFDLASLKSFNAQLARPGGKLAPTPFGQRLAQAYQAGAGLLLGADLEKIKGLIPFGNKRDEAGFRQTGFADVKYLIAEHKDATGQPSNNAELTFAGPRRGVASWLAAPAPMGGLDFISTDAGYVGSLVLKNPAQIFDDVKDIAEAGRPGASADLAQAETQFNIKLKEDLLSKLGGEITLALDGPISSKTADPPWRAVLKVRDPDGLQKTFQQLLMIAGGFAKGEQQPTLEQHISEGQTSYTLQIFTAKKPIEVDYAFVDGYMVLAGSRTLLADAIQVHRSGKSLAKSAEFQALVPRDHSKDSSAMVYQNFIRMIGPMLQQSAPELAKLVEGTEIKIAPTATFAYGEENAIRFASNNTGGGVGAVLIIAAVAIPNLMRSRTEANESGGIATVRTLNTAQVTYSATYPEKGFAPDLATLGSGPDGNCQGGGSTSHACLIDDTLACASGTSGEWCTKNGFRYSITATCKEGICDGYVIVGTPVSTSTGGKNFCSSNDAVIRVQTGAPLTSPITVEECQTWSPL